MTKTSRTLIFKRSSEESLVVYLRDVQFMMEDVNIQARKM